jgi:uncharacterized cupin superfamily protein
MTTDSPHIHHPGEEPVAADGPTFSVHEWRGSGPPQLHVHHQDDEAWHVLEGELEFRFGDGTREVARAGSTVFVPAGVPHTYVCADEARYLIVLTPRLRELIEELHTVPPAGHADVYERYGSELLED